MKTKTRYNSYQAVTLLESVVYLAIFGALFLTIMQLFFVINETNRITQDRITLEKSSMLILHHLEESFVGAGSVNQSGSSFGVDQGSLHLMGTDEIVYSLSGGVIQVDRGEGPVALSHATYSVTIMRFDEVYNQNDDLVGVRVNVTLQSRKHDRVQKSFQTSYVITSNL